MTPITHTAGMNTGLTRGRAFRVAVCLALAATLAGCMQLHVGLTVNADDTVDGQLLLIAEKKWLTSRDRIVWPTTRNRTVQVGFAELRKNMPSLPPGEESVYENATHYGSLINYRRTPLADFRSDSLNLVRDGDLLRFHLSLDPRKYGGKVAEEDPRNQALFLQSASFEISVTFPGRVIDSNGAVTGRSVTWKVGPSRDKPTELRAVAEAPLPATPAATGPGGTARDADDDSVGWLVVGIGAVVLLLAGAGVVVLLRRRRGGAVPTPSAPTDTAAASAAEHPV
ncbi:LppM family (lipo)protein [Micromonospora citrea]|uniref:LppM family (lipo)protein n=1 Tax=Micromonospora citrea TaxID=47855 RepID=UPI003C6005A2